MDESIDYTPAKVVQVTKWLEQHIDELLAGLAMARKPREILTIAKEKISEATVLLEEVDRDYVPLIIARDDRPLSACRAEWAALPVGRIRAVDSSVKHLIARSPTLAAMFRGGLDFLDFHHFGADDLKLAGDIFEIFTESPPAWNDVRRLIADREQAWLFRKPDFQLVNQIGKRLRDTKVFSSYGFELCPRKTNRWEPVRDSRSILRLPDDVRLRLTFELTREQWILDLVHGHWLTALALNIVSDHLERNSMDFEAYTKVGYRTAQGLSHVRSDFDLLVCSQDRILAIECKSGSLDASRGDFNECITKAQQLTDAFKATNTNLPLTFWLVYNHHLTKPETVTEHLQQSPMTGVTIEHLRGKVIELFK